MRYKRSPVEVARYRDHRFLNAATARIRQVATEPAWEDVARVGFDAVRLRPGNTRFSAMLPGVADGHV
jgi:hypothetical protein